MKTKKKLTKFQKIVRRIFIGVISIALLVVMVGIGVVVNQRLKEQAVLNEAVRKIADDIGFTQAMALRYKSYYGIKFEESSNSYYIYEYDIDNKKEVVIKHPSNPSIEFKVLLGMGFPKTSIANANCDTIMSNNYILFSEKGVPADSAGIPYYKSCAIKIVHQAGFYKIIQVEPLTGNISIQ